MEIALYYAPNTCALAPYVTLTEAGADFEVRPLNFRKRQNFTPEYLKINPKHKVPSLVVDGKILHRERRYPSMGPSDFSRSEDPARRSVGPVAGDLAARLVCQRHPPLSEPHQQPAQSLRRAWRVRQRDQVRDGSSLRELPDRRRFAGRARVLLRPFHRTGRAFLLVLPPRHPVGGGHLRLPQRHGALQAHAGAPERQEAARLRERSE